ncbi:MAG: DUF1573 domain-containing protein [Armatimonadota bacterium]
MAAVKPGTRQTLIWLALVALALVAAVSAETGTTGRPKIEVAEEEFDFGTCLVKQKVTHSYKIKNAGDADLTITDVRASCGCTATALAKRSLARGESTDLTVTYTASVVPGKVRKYVTIKSNDPERPTLRLVISGTVKAYVEVIPRFLNLGDMTPDLRTVRKIFVKPLNREGFKVTKVRCSVPQIAGEIVPKPSPATGAYQILVSVGPDLPVGRLRATMTIETTDPHQPKTSLTIYGNVIEPPK